MPRRTLRSANRPQPKHKSHRRPLRLEALERRDLLASDVITGLGVLGDSYSDEYDPQPYTYASNWVELLASRGVNFGTHGAQGDFRGVGYEYNYSLNGATSLDLTLQFAPSQLATALFEGEVSHGVMMAGMSDFADAVSALAGVNVYEQIYSGAWSDADIQFHTVPLANMLSGNITTFAETGAGFVVVTIPDPGDSPALRAKYPVAASRQRVTNAIQSVNAALKQRAAENGLPVFDLFALQKALLGTHASPIASQSIGGVTFTATAGGAANSTALFTQDGLHPHTALQAIIANGVMTALNLGYAEDLCLFSEQEIVTLAGQTFTVNTLNLNYANYVTVPDLPIVLDFGSPGDPLNDFAARIEQLWNGNGGTGIGGNLGALSPAEINQLRADVLSKVQAAFSASAIGDNNLQIYDYASLSDAMKANVSKYHHISLGLAHPPGGSRNAIIGHFGEDWRNTQLSGSGFIAPNELSTLLTDVAGLDRAARIQYIRNALTFYTVQGIGLSLGLTHADALGRPQITPANYANTGGAQNIDYMSGNEALGFNIASLKNNVAFSFSPLAKAKLQMGTRVYDNRLAPVAETTSPHANTGSAQSIALQAVAGTSVRAGGVARASISSAGQTDVYSFEVQLGQLITVQTLRAHDAVGALNTRIRLLSPNGQEIAANDDTALGYNSLNPASGAVLQSTHSLILNFVATTTGKFFVEVTGVAGSTGEYDLLIATMPPASASSPWQNPAEPLNVDNQPGIVALDALIIINELNNRQYSEPDGRLRPPPVDKPPPYYDVDGNGYVIALDALIIINYLNRNPVSGAGGEGEAPATVFDAPNSATPENVASVFAEVGTAPEFDLLAATDWFWQSNGNKKEKN